MRLARQTHVRAGGGDLIAREADGGAEAGGYGAFVAGLADETVDALVLAPAWGGGGGRGRGMNEEGGRTV